MCVVFFMEIITVIALTTIIIAREIIHFMERKDLSDRLMSKSLDDFKVNTATDEENVYSEEKDDTVTNLQDAKEDIIGE